MQKPLTLNPGDPTEVIRPAVTWLTLKHKLHGANNDFLQIINFLDVATDQLVTLEKGHGTFLSLFPLKSEKVGLFDHQR